MAFKLVFGAVCGSAAICLGLLNPQVVTAPGSQELTHTNLTPHAVSHEPSGWASHPAAFSSVDLWQVMSAPRH